MRASSRRPERRTCTRSCPEYARSALRPTGAMRLRVGSLFLAAAAAAAALEGPHVKADGLVYAGIAAVLLLVPRFWAQLLARGLAWYLVVDGAVANVTEHGDAATFAMLLFAATGLVIAGGRGLDEPLPHSTFTPVAFRRTLILSMIAAIAQAAWFASSLLAMPFADYWAIDPLPLALGAAGAASLVGIGSLRGWGLVLQAVLQIAVTAWLVAWCVLLHPHEGYL